MRGLVVVALAVGAGCPREPPRCGDGVADPGEDASTCCLDVPCALGACGAVADDAAPRCLMPWEAACAAAGAACLDGTPYACGADASMPRYDCASCGCGGADACVEGVCYDAATRGGARDLDVLPDDLELADYVGLLTDLRARDARPMAEVAAAHVDEPRADPRRATFVIGWDARSPDDAALQGAWLEALGVHDAASTAQRCVEPDALWPDGALVQVVPPDAAARVTCAWPGMFVDCVLPLATDCVLGAGFLAEAVIFLDLDVVLDDADAAMLVRVGRVPASQRDAMLDQALAVWLDAASSVGAQPGLAIEVAGGVRYAATYPSDDPHVSWVLLDARRGVPLRMRTYRVVWSDPPSQQFLVEHDIQTRDCAFDTGSVAPGALPPSVSMTCTNAGATLVAEVETAGFTLVDVATTGG